MEKVKYGVRKVASKSLTGGWVVVQYDEHGATPLAESEYIRICTTREKSTKTGAEISRSSRASKIDGRAAKVSQLARAIASAWTLTQATDGAKCTAIVSKYGRDCADAVDAVTVSTPGSDERTVLARSLACLSKKIESEYAYKYTLDNWARVNR